MNNRISWIDNARFLAISCVVFGHVLGFLTNHNIEGYDLVQGVIVSFNMPLFFVLSGFCSGKQLCALSDTISWWKYVKKVTIRILLPSYVFSIITYLLGLSNGLFSSYWFLPILWRLLVIFSIITFLFNSFPKVKKYACRGGYYVAFLIACQFLGNRTGEFCLYIIYGMFLHEFLNSRKTMSIIPFLFVTYIPT